MNSLWILWALKLTKVQKGIGQMLLDKDMPEVVPALQVTRKLENTS